MVPALAAWHVHHDRAARAIVERGDRGEALIVAAPALVETYSVLTRVPPPLRMQPDDAWQAIRVTFVDVAARIVALEIDAYIQLLARAGRDAVAGGLIYDAVIAACAERAAVSTLLTFNVGHFRPLVPAAIEVVAPADLS